MIMRFSKISAGILGGTFLREEEKGGECESRREDGGEMENRQELIPRR